MAPPEERRSGAADPAAELSVVILNWNRAAATLACLAALASWRRLRAQLWVVDNASTEDGTEQIPRRFPGVRWLRAPANLGFGGGNNLALSRIESRYALLLNNDARIDEDGVAALLATLEAEPRLAALGPVVHSPGEPERVLSAGGRDILRHVRTHLGADDLPPGRLCGTDAYDVSYVPGSAVVLRMTAVRELGLLDEDYFFGGELADLCARARRRGWRTAILPSALAWHDLDVASSFRRQLYPYYILRNRFLFLRKRAGASAALYAPLWTAYGLAAAARAALRADRLRARALLLAVGDGLAGRRGCQNHRFGGAVAENAG